MPNNIYGGLIYMEVGKTFKKMMIDKDVKQIEIANNIGLKKQNFNDQLKRDNFRINDVIKIADNLGYDVKLQFVDRDNGKIIDVENKYFTSTPDTKAGE